jgi:hypothetical protein
MAPRHPEGVRDAPESGAAVSPTGLNFGALVIAGVAAVSLWASPVLAAPVLGMDRAIPEVQTDLGRLCRCSWLGPVGPPGSPGSTCPAGNAVLNVTLYSDGAGERLDTVQLVPLLQAHLHRRLKEEKRTRKAVIDVIRYLLPTWKSGPTWTSNALANAVHSLRGERGRRLVKVGDVTVFVQQASPVDLEDIYAEVVVTRRPSLEQWNSGD